METGQAHVKHILTPRTVTFKQSQYELTALICVSGKFAQYVPEEISIYRAGKDVKLLWVEGI